MTKWEGRETEEEPEQGRRSRERLLSLTVAIFLAALAVSGILIFYRYLDNALFQERNSHFIEITDKTALVIESEVQHYRALARIAEHLLMQSMPEETEALPECLEDICASLELNPGMVLAFDSEAGIYGSDGSAGDKKDTDLITGKGEEWEVVATLDSQADDSPYILFVKALDSPQRVGTKRITHIAVGTEIGFSRIPLREIFFTGKAMYM